MKGIIGLRIKELRKEKKLTQLEFSSKIGIDNSQLSKIEQGKLMPTLNQLMDISSIFDVSIEYLVSNKSPQNSTEENLIIDEPNPIRDKLITVQQELLEYKECEIIRLKEEIIELKKEKERSDNYSHVAKDPTKLKPG